MTTPLPVTDALPALSAALADKGVAVLTAPPGAGKTTLVPLALMDQPWAKGRILMLEPRRLAARAAAERMAELTDTAPGQTIGYRIRGEAKTSSATRVEVVTEGILTRMLQSDPELTGISAVIFDEFHERSLHADLGLALTLECRAALRPDLRVLVMSATLDAGPVAALIGADVISSEGRAYPVETRWLDTPWPRTARRREDAVAALIHRAWDEAPGDVLSFLPGVGEIERTRRALSGLDADIHALHGGLSFRDQRAALAPSQRRKIVLATAIAETSLTVEGVRIVVDAGQARRARFDPGAGMSRLVTERVSKAEADQRRGRAARLAPGVCYRLWTRGEEGALSPFAPPEIEIADLSPLALELANWGAAEGDLAFLTAPPEGALAEARALLSQLGALDPSGGITAHGRALAAAPTHPRLAHMILTAPKGTGRTACTLAALLEDRDPLRSEGADLTLRLRALKTPKAHGPAAASLARINAERDRLARRLSATGDKGDPGPLIARAFPDRIAQRRPGGAARYLLSGGRGAVLRDEDSLAAAPYLAVADLDGGGRDAAIRLAAPLSIAEIEDLFIAEITEARICEWSRRDRKVIARRRRMLGALALEDEVWRDAPPDAVAAAMTDGVRDLGLAALPWSAAARRFAARAVWARAHGAEITDLSEVSLADTMATWLTPFLTGITTAGGLAALDMLAILKSALGWEGAAIVDKLAPVHFTTPAGSKIPIDYDGAAPSAAMRLQELFGMTTHPTVGPDRTPLLLELLSPAGRPVQTTADLPGFWASSYSDVRKDMRGRYPRHPWPEDPAAAPPTRRVKPRGT